MRADWIRGNEIYCKLKCLNYLNNLETFPGGAAKVDSVSAGGGDLEGKRAQPGRSAQTYLFVCPPLASEKQARARPSLLHCNHYCPFVIIIIIIIITITISWRVR